MMQKANCEVVQMWRGRHNRRAHRYKLKRPVRRKADVIKAMKIENKNQSLFRELQKFNNQKGYKK